MAVNVINGRFRASWLEDLLFDKGVYDIGGFLNLTDAALEPPQLYDNMEQGYRLVKSSNAIGILIDPDPDGFTSAAILYLYLDKIGKKNVKTFMHQGRQHGLADKTVLEEIKTSSIDLLIIPDGGSNDYAEHQALQSMGIQVLVIDHHECKEYSPFACVINNQLSPNVKNKSLSGAGVAYKFLAYCDGYYQVGYKQYVDLVALGNISDMMDVTSDETRLLCLDGLRPNNLNNDFLKAIYQKYAGSPLTMNAVAWNVTPKINALIRMGGIEAKRQMFEAFVNPNAEVNTVSDKRVEGRNIKDHVIAQMAKAKGEQDRKVKKGIQLLKEKLDFSSRIIVGIVDGELDSAVFGLVANKLAAEYKKPALVLNGENDGVFAGSARSPRQFGDMKNFKQYLKQTTYADLCEGHPNAFGVRIQRDKIAALVARVEGDFAGIDVSQYEFADFSIPAIELTNNDIEDVGRYEWLWGAGLSEPKILIQDVEIDSEYINMSVNRTVLTFRYAGITYSKKFCSKEFRCSLGVDGAERVCTKADIIGRFKIEKYGCKTYHKVLIDKVVKRRG